jgi:hypothetical protein
MDGFELEAARRAPLADATYQLFRFALDHEFLAQVFDRHRGRSYEAELSFTTVVHLLGDALLEQAGSARRALRQARGNAELPVSNEAFYAKLRRIPQCLSQGLLSQVTRRLLPLFVPTRSPIPPTLQQFEVLAVDGKKIKHAAKRLKPTRAFRGSVLGGKLLVALDLETGLAVAMNSSLDGEANDPPLVPGLLKELNATPRTRPRLYVLDRQFCDLKLPKLLTADGDHFLIRYHRKVTFTRDDSHPARTGTDAAGRTFTDERGWLGRADHKQRRYVRRVTVHREGEDDVSVLTDLLDEEAFPGAELLELYHQRWGIERVFQQVTEVFHLQRLVASSPQGTIFQAAFCLLLYNLLQVQRSYVAAAQQIELERISLENLFYDVRRQLIAWNELIPRSWTLAHFADTQPLSSTQQRLHALLDRQWKAGWLKAPNKKHRPKQLAPPHSGGHTSIHRLIHPNHET